MSDLTYVILNLNLWNTTGVWKEEKGGRKDKANWGYRGTESCYIKILTKGNFYFYEE